jgi:hypothetical protein
MSKFKEEISQEWMKKDNRVNLICPTCKQIIPKENTGYYTPDNMKEDKQGKKEAKSSLRQMIEGLKDFRGSE